MVRLVPAVLALGLLMGCTPGGSTSEDAAQADSRAAGGGAPAASVQESADYAVDSGKSAPASAQSQGKLVKGVIDASSRALIKTAALSVQVDDVADALGQMSDLAVVAGGEIASEETSTNRRGDPVNSRLVVRVPVADFDATVDKIASLGKLQRLARSVEDVTTRVADIDSRVTSAEDSITQLRRLFGAAKKLGQIIALESELSQREADLEALQAQQRALADSTAMSTITVTVSSPPATSTTTPPSSDRAGGFIAGLKTGWHELGSLVRTLGHVLGVTLPFILFLLLLTAIGWFVVRRVMPRLATGPPPQASEEARPAG